MKLADIFGDNMVFQAEKPFRIFGSGKGTVSVELGGEIYEKTFDREMWLMELPPQPYGTPCDVFVILNGEKQTLKNIVFGDVFLCAGQSNMQFTIALEQDYAPIEFDEKIRYYASPKGLEECSPNLGAWYVLSAENVENWSALGLHIAQEYRKKKDVYVGIVGSFQGASVIRTWMPERVLDEAVYLPPEERKHVNVFDNNWKTDCFMYNKSFRPLAPYSFLRAIWYQGESDTCVAEGAVYTELLRRLIESWREDLMDLSLPFTVIEICDYDSRNDEGWRTIQNCQQQIVNFTKNVNVVTSKDVCEHSNIHPANKEGLAKKVVASF